MRLIEILVVEQRIDESIAILEVSVVVHKLVPLVGLIVLQVDSLEPFQDGQLGGRVAEESWVPSGYFLTETI